MTDAEIEAYGDTLAEAFANAALALEDTMVDVRTIEPTKNSKIVLHAEDKEALLYSWLEELIVIEETRGLLFSKFECKIFHETGKGYSIEAEAWGEKFDEKKHEQKTGVKAPTYHDMEIKEENVKGRNRIKLRFLLDL